MFENCVLNNTRFSNNILDESVIFVDTKVIEMDYEKKYTGKEFLRNYIDGEF